MDKKDKLLFSETDICNLFIAQALKTSGWDPMTQIRREVTLTPGPVIVRGNASSRNQKKKNLQITSYPSSPRFPSPSSRPRVMRLASATDFNRGWTMPAS
ncbi:hypothetical protein [Hoeflea halophila]|uniref:hypothetical protein n=1 Tax=Hoeflea halophila TaxID=714899 RepID=UPI001AEF673B|nr:hypothetical protein [Hoeflea halophila]